jgi:hypothetical protein
MHLMYRGIYTCIMATSSRVTIQMIRALLFTLCPPRARQLRRKLPSPHSHRLIYQREVGALAEVGAVTLTPLDVSS